MSSGRSRLSWCLVVTSLGCAPLLDLDHDYRLKDTPGSGSDAGGSTQGGSQPSAGAGTSSGGAGTSSGGGGSSAGGVGGNTGPPTLPSGKLVFHSYSSYDSGDSKMYVVDLPGGTVSPELGQAFGVCSPRGATFNPNGTKVVVAAQPSVDGACPAYSRDALEIFILDLTTLASATPAAERVTSNSDADEDPQFAPHSDYLLLKHKGHLAKWLLGSPPLTTCEAQTAGSFCFKSMGNEEIKPVISDDEATICYQAGPVPDADILCFDRLQAEAGGEIRSISLSVAVHSVAETRASFGKTWLYYTRWRLLDNGVDTIVRKPAAKDKLLDQEQEASFASNGVFDYSDPFAIDGDLLVFSSDASGAGKHDLFVGTFGQTAAYSLDNWSKGLNSKQDELGPCFWKAP